MELVMCRKLILASLIFLLIGCATVHPFTTRIPKKPTCSLRFATYNVFWLNHSNNKFNSHSITHIIDEIHPDIIVLQETYCFNKNHLEKQFYHSHPYHLFRHCSSSRSQHESGLGILSKYPIVKNIYFPPVYGWFPGWLFVVKTPKGYVQILNVHLNPKLVSQDNIGLFAEGLWLTPQLRLQEIAYYYKFLNPNLPTIIAGDFNENDTGAAANFLRNKCFDDLLLGIPRCIKTWRYQVGVFNLSGRYDRIYTAGLKPLRCQVVQRGYSDHYPVVIDYF